ncbi:MAG: hypothetical protein ACMXYL_03800 [Candidatus Woesearchaeota archaeon]
MVVKKKALGPKRMFTRDEEHMILVRVVDKFLLFGFAFLGLTWYWLATKVLYLTPVQQAVMFGSLGIFSVLVIFTLITMNYEYNKKSR